MTDIDEETLARLLSELRTDALPTPWAVVEARLRREGLIKAEAGAHGAAAGFTVRRLAAALVMLAIGFGAGVAIARRDSSAPSARLSAVTDSLDPTVALRGAETAYRAALLRVTTAASPGTSSSTRLAVLQAIVLTTSAALHDAPEDPLINGYHMAALAQRDALLGTASAVVAARWF